MTPRHTKTEAEWDEPVDNLRAALQDPVDRLGGQDSESSLKFHGCSYTSIVVHRRPRFPQNKGKPGVLSCG